MLHQLGSGVLGPVFRAHDDERDRLVAVKVFRLDLTPELADDVGDDLQALVRHWPTAMPGLVRPVRAGVDQATPWLAQEFAQGDGLDALLRKRARPTVDAVVGLVSRIADALDAGAADGWTHGALHPRDILVTPDLEAIAITGVGIAHVVERAGFRAPRRRPYVAPERIAGHGWDARADLYSLAVIALELIGTRRASSGGHLPVATVLDEAGLDIERWSRALTRALAEDPAQRFQTAREFADALEAACSSDGRAPRLPLEDAEEPAFAFDDVATGDDAAPPASPSPVHPDDAPEAPALFDRDDIDVHPGVQRAASPLLDDPLGEDDGLEVTRPAGHVRFDDAEEPAAGRATEWSMAEGDAQRVAAAPGQPVAGRPYGLLAATLLLGIFIGFLGGAWMMRGRAFGASSSPAPVAEAPVARAAVTDEPVMVNDVSPGAAEPPPASTAPPATPSAVPAVAPAPVATSSAPADPTPGVLRVTSSPGGARVTIDGRSRGTTPLVVRDLRLGTYQVTVAREGYQERSMRVSLTDGRRDASVAVTLPRAASRRAAAPAAASTAPGTMVIATRPAGARVFLDGRPAGTTPVTIPNVSPGAHQLRLELPGHRPWTTAVDVTSNQTRRVSASLEPGGAR